MLGPRSVAVRNSRGRGEKKRRDAERGGSIRPGMPRRPDTFGRHWPAGKPASPTGQRIEGEPLARAPPSPLPIGLNSHSQHVRVQAEPNGNRRVGCGKLERPTAGAYCLIGVVSVRTAGRETPLFCFKLGDRVGQGLRERAQRVPDQADPVGVSFGDREYFADRLRIRRQSWWVVSILSLANHPSRARERVT